MNVWRLYAERTIPLRDFVPISPASANLWRHGFIYHSGTWATLDYPNSTLQTTLNGISNSNLITATTIQGSNALNSFIYVNGGFKKIVMPNSINPTYAYGVSLNKGPITGFSGYKGYIATCQANKRRCGSILSICYAKLWAKVCPPTKRPLTVRISGRLTASQELVYGNQGTCSVAGPGIPSIMYGGQRNLTLGRIPEKRYTTRTPT